MKKIIIATAVAALTILSSYSPADQTVWTNDKAHSKLGFSVSHLMVSDVEGSFKSFESKITSSGENFENASIELSADINSINTDSDQRDAHLKGTDFFDATKYPVLLFKSKSFKKLKDKEYKLTGELTMHGITKSVSLDATFKGTAVHPYTKKTIAGFKISGVIKRSDFGIGTSTPSAVVSDEVAITSNIEFTKE